MHLAYFLPLRARVSSGLCLSSLEQRSRWKSLTHAWYAHQRRHPGWAVHLVQEPEQFGEHFGVGGLRKGAVAAVRAPSVREGRERAEA